MADSIFELWSDLSISGGDMLLVHSSMHRIMRTYGVSPKQVIDYFLERVGPEGTLLFPTFNINVEPHLVFDLIRTPSKMGTLTKAAMNDNRFTRTLHPILSFAVAGKHREHLRSLDSYTGIDEDSVFATLHKNDAKIAIIDLAENDSMSFYHHVESCIGVDYRWVINFEAEIVLENGDSLRRKQGFYARRRDDGVTTAVNPMGEHLWTLGYYSGMRPGEGHGTRVIGARRLYSETAAVIQSGRAEGMLYEQSKT